MKPIRRHVPGPASLGRQDKTAQPPTSLEEPEGDARTAQAMSRCQPGQTAADDKDRVGHEPFEWSEMPRWQISRRFGDFANEDHDQAQDTAHP